MKLKLLAFIGLFIFVCGNAWAVEPGAVADRLATGKASIIDYFLACNACSMEYFDEDLGKDHLAFRKKVSNDKSIQFIDRHGYKRNIIIDRKVVDPKNGYMQMEIGEQLSSVYTGAIFSREANGPVFVWTSTEFGGDSDEYYFQFFEPQGASWKEVTHDILPTFSVTDFAVQQKMFEFADQVEWEIVLPRYGTTAYLLHHPHWEIGESEQKFKTYKAYFGNNVAMELVWDKRDSRFLKGRLLDYAAFQKAQK